jgi:hypothetical protein
LKNERDLITKNNDNIKDKSLKELNNLNKQILINEENISTKK